MAKMPRKARIASTRKRHSDGESAANPVATGGAQSAAALLVLGVQIPDDFPIWAAKLRREPGSPASEASTDMEVAIVDTAIAKLFRAREELRLPAWRPAAKARIRAAWSALAPFGDAPRFHQRRHEVLVWALDAGARVHDPELGLMMARLVIGEALPDRRIAPEVLRRAIELWPDTKRRTERTLAVREVAQALGCDTRSLMTMLRQARTRLRAATPRRTT